MIKASEARKTSKEAKEAKRKHLLLKESKELEQKLKARMSDADLAVKAAMKRGEEKIRLDWSQDELPQPIRKQFEEQVTADGYAVAVHPNDDGVGWEITISWEGE